MRWLTHDEQSTWRAFLRARQVIDKALDRQLMTDSGMPHAYFAILVTLSESDDEACRMNDLAARLQYSPSRLTHAVRKMETDGWLQRTPCPTDKRGQIATLTDAGREVLEAAAPGHVLQVRQLIFDQLTAAQQAGLRDACETILRSDSAPILS